MTDDDAITFSVPTEGTVTHVAIFDAGNNLVATQLDRIEELEDLLRDLRYGLSRLGYGEEVARIDAILNDD